MFRSQKTVLEKYSLAKFLHKLISKIWDTYFILRHQMSTSVLRIPVRVMKTLVVATARGLTAVHVNKVTLEMALTVKVCTH